MRTAVGYTCLGGLFAIAAVGVLGQNFQPLSHFEIALALTLLCVDQGRMALVDFRNISQVSSQLGEINKIEVTRFSTITSITIIIELLGFYLAWSLLGLGTALVLISQLFFNTIAQVQLYPGHPDPVQPFGVQKRKPVLIANAIALVLVMVWQIGYLSHVVAGLLLVMVVTYLVSKYLTVYTTAMMDGSDSL